MTWIWSTENLELQFQPYHPPMSLKMLNVFTGSPKESSVTFKPASVILGINLLEYSKTECVISGFREIFNICVNI